jgi:hypothetical protein
LEGTDASQWFVAEGYEVRYEEIRPVGKVGRRTEPLSDQDLFLSFARLGGEGEPSEARILSWVRKHGLLLRMNPALKNMVLDAERTPNQAPMTLTAFRSEFRHAYRALTLLQAIRSRDFVALRSRLTRTSRGIGSKQNVKRMEVLLDGVPVPRTGPGEGDLYDMEVLEAATNGLLYIVERRLSTVRLALGKGSERPRPLSITGGYLPFRPRLTPHCPDLLSAMWLQFAALISDQRQWRECKRCGLPFIDEDRDDVWCSPACKQERHRLSP